MVARILGARHLGEATLVALQREDGAPPRWPMVIDLVHASSMLVVALLSPRLRRDALASAGMSAGLARISARERRTRR